MRLEVSNRWFELSFKSLGFRSVDRWSLGFRSLSFVLGLEFSVFVFGGQKFWVWVLCLMLWWCGGLIFRICSCIILCWCGSNANFLGFKFSVFVFLFKCLMCSCLISCSCLIWCGFGFSVFDFWVCMIFLSLYSLNLN